jgi:hypothetical protein
MYVKTEIMMSINKTQGYLIYCALRVFKHNEFNYISMRTSIKVYDEETYT